MLRDSLPFHGYSLILSQLEEQSCLLVLNFLPLEDWLRSFLFQNNLKLEAKTFVIWFALGVYYALLSPLSMSSPLLPYEEVHSSWSHKKEGKKTKKIMVLAILQWKLKGVILSFSQCRPALSTVYLYLTSTSLISLSLSRPTPPLSFFLSLRLSLSLCLSVSLSPPLSQFPSFSMHIKRFLTALLYFNLFKCL